MPISCEELQFWIFMLPLAVVMWGIAIALFLYMISKAMPNPWRMAEYVKNFAREFRGPQGERGPAGPAGMTGECVDWKQIQTFIDNHFHAEMNSFKLNAERFVVEEIAKQIAMEGAKKKQSARRRS